MVCLWLLTESKDWANDRATECLMDVMREGTGNSPVSKWYHLLYFHPIKIPVLCSGDLKLLEVIEGNDIHGCHTGMVL